MERSQRGCSRRRVERKLVLLAALALLLSTPYSSAEEHGEDDWHDDWFIQEWSLDCAGEYDSEWVWTGEWVPEGIEPVEEDTSLEDGTHISFNETGPGNLTLSFLDEHGDPVTEEWVVIDEEMFWHWPESLEYGYGCVNSFLSDEDLHDEWCDPWFILDPTNPIGTLDLLHDFTHEGIDFHYVEDGELIPWTGEYLEEPIYVFEWDDDDEEVVIELFDWDPEEADLDFLFDLTYGNEVDIDDEEPIILADLVQQPPSFGENETWGLQPCWLVYDDEWQEPDLGLLWVTWSTEFLVAEDVPGMVIPPISNGTSPPENETSPPATPDLPNPPPPEPPDWSDSEAVQQIIQIAPAAGAVTGASAMGAAFASSEALRYPFMRRWWLLLGLLMSVKKREGTGDYQRGRIVGVIGLHQGMHLSALVRALGMGNHQAAHHIRILEREGIIWHRRIGREVRFFTADVPAHLATDELPRPKIILTEESIPHKMLMALMELAESGSEGCSQKKLAKLTKSSEQLVSYHLRALGEYGLVEKRRSGLGNIVRITAEGLEALAGGEPPFTKPEELTEEERLVFDQLISELSESI